MSILEIIILVGSILSFIVVAIWLIWIWKRASLLGKNVFKSIKSNLFNFTGMIIFFAVTMSIVSGSMIASNNSINTVAETFKKGNQSNAITPLKGLTVNTKRMMNFHKVHQAGATGGDLNDPTDPTPIDFNVEFGTSVNHWNNTSLASTVPSFQDWAFGNNTWTGADGVTHNSIRTQNLLNEYLVFNRTPGQEYNPDNRMAMFFYSFEMLREFGSNDVNPKEFTYVRETRSNQKLFSEIYDKESNENLNSAAVRLVMIPDKDGAFDKPILDQSGKKYISNNLIIEDNHNKQVNVDSEGYVNLNDDQAVIIGSFIDQNKNINLGDSFEVGSLSNTETLTLAGTGFMPSEINRKGLFSTNPKWYNCYLYLC